MPGFDKRTQLPSWSSLITQSYVPIRYKSNVIWKFKLQLYTTMCNRLGTPYILHVCNDLDASLLVLPVKEHDFSCRQVEDNGHTTTAHLISHTSSGAHQPVQSSLDVQRGLASLI